MRGSALQSVQWIANKALTAAATLALAHWLSPSAYGAGMQALAIYQAIALPIVLGVGDVLISRRGHAARLSAAAQRAARIGAFLSSALVMVSVPVVVSLMTSGEGQALGWMLAVLALRPLLESWLVLPYTRLRLAMAYPKLALVDGVVQAGATLASVALAASGAGCWSVVLPQMVAIGARAAWMRRLAACTVAGPVRMPVVRRLLHRTAQSAMAQHVHSAINGLEVILLGWLATQAAAGTYAFALSLAAQANTVLAYQLGVVLQPVLSHLQHDPRRQVDGFLRAQRVLASVCVPICLTQAIVAEPAFRLLFDARWQSAAPLFATLSLMLGFHVAVGPSMACLRAQGRFRALLAWQLVHLLVAVPVFMLAIVRHGPVGAALATLSLWMVSGTFGMWLCTWTIGGAFRSCLAVTLRAWAIALGPTTLAWFAVEPLSRMGSTGDAIAVCGLGPVLAIVSVMLQARFDAQVHEALGRAWSAVRRRA